MSKDVKNVPALRFKGYSDAWEKRKLGDLGSVAMNKRIYKDQTSDEGEIPFYKIGSFGKQADAFISRKLFNEYKKLYPFPKKGDILISASGSIGRTIVYNGEDAYFQDSNIIWIQHDNRLDNTFLHQLFNIIRWSGVEGTTIKRLYNKNILSTQILLPSVEEQRSIGSLLDNVDNLIAATQDKLSFLKKMKMFFLQQIFPTKDHDVPQIRFDGFTDAWSHYKLGSLMRIDKEQEVKKELLTDIQKGFYVLAMRTFSMDGYIDHSKPYWLNHLDNVSDDKFLLPREFAILDADMDANLPKIGRVLLNASSEKYLLAAHVRKIQVKSGNDPIFIYALMRGNSVHERLKLEANGSISKRLLDKNVYKQSILVPNRSEQSKIGRLFFLLETTITLHQQKIQMLKQVKKSCLQNLFI